MFESEGERIDWLIEQVEGRGSNTTVPPLDPQDIEVFHITASWLARCTSLTKGLLVLVRDRLYEPAGVVHRSSWELWIDWKYLLRVGNRRLNAAKVLLSAQIGTLEFTDFHHDAFDSGYLERLHQNLLDFESRHPEASAEVRQQRRKRYFHWSGLTYSRMERELAGEPGIYGALSWEVHGTVSPMRDVQLDVSDNAAFFRFGQTEETYRPDFLLFSVGGVLFHVYNDFADMWGLQPIEFRKSR
ncbi:MAG TPA: DUF5677 domain-containing protein [Terriglobia bacterium]|nr:DUF5677 domain-containing protein [Terriglobia bacterium]